MKPTPKDRRFLSALLFFERAAQHLSFTAAAHDLHVTTSAVSHQIKHLEKALGVQLFDRKVRAVTLTPDGGTLLHATASALSGLENAVSAIARPHSLRVSVGPFLSTRWLMPKLRRFERICPGVHIDLLHGPGPPDLRDVDIAIIWGDAAWHRRGGQMLFDAEIAPLAAVKLCDGDNPEIPFWETGLLPLHYRDRTAWRVWCEAADAPQSYAERGDVYDDPNVVLEAAVHGRGAALGFLPFVVEELSRGRLQLLHQTRTKAPEAYWVVPGHRKNPATENFTAWLQSEAKEISCPSGHRPPP